MVRPIIVSDLQSKIVSLPTTPTAVLNLFAPPITCVLFFYVVCFRSNDQGSSIIVKTRRVMYFLHVVAWVNFTVVIVESYDLAKALGRGVGFSGLLIGMYTFGTVPGMIIACALDQFLPIPWKDYPRRLLLCCCCCQILGSAVFCWASFKASTHTAAVNHLATILLAARMVSGIGSGAINQFNYSSMPQLVTKAEVPEAMLRLFLVCMVGIGIGPLLSSFALVCAPSIHFGTSGISSFILSLASVLVTRLMCPSVLDSDDLPQQRLEDTAVSEEDERVSDVVVIVCCLLLSAVRSCIVSGLEAASALILEMQYGWSQRWIGTAIGATFLFCLPAKLVHGSVRYALTAAGWIRVFSCISIAGSLLLHKQASDMISPSHRGEVLLLGDVVLFPSIYLADGLSVGIMSLHFQRVGSLFDRSKVMLVFGLLNSGVARGLGPWWARVVITAGGQDLYALQQTALAVFFLVGFETLVHPWTRSMS